MLKVWLPLDGDLRNLGISNIEITNHGATINNSGKIGKCYQFDNSSSYIELNCSELYKILNGGTQPFSVCFWVNQIDSSRAIILGDYSVSGGNNFNIELNVNHNLRWYWGTPDIVISAMNVGINTWTHVTFTYSGTVLKGYINGIEKYTNTITLNEKNRTSGSYYLGRDGRTGTTTLNGYLNDFRIYDHCLSAAEVHEIAQGLVVHYKLDSIKIKTGTNLVTGITTGGQTTALTDGRIGVQTSGENKDTYFSINLSENITNGTKYFLSCDASGISEGAYWGFPLGHQNNFTLLFKIYNGHNEYSFTANDISWGSNRLFMDDYGRADWANKATFWNFELYKNPTLEVEDSSGYGCNATLYNGGLTTDTPRYAAALTSDNPTQAVGDPIIEVGTLISEYTWVGWIKRNYTTATARSIHDNIVRISLHTDFTTNIMWISRRTNGSNISRNLRGGTVIALDEWVHMAITYKSGIWKLYINGELNKTWDDSSYGVYIFASRVNDLGNGFIGNLSDIRIYTTALLDTDIKLLYNMGSRIDNLGGIHSFEVNEIDDNLLAGVVITSNYGNRINPYTKYNSNGELYFDTNGTSAGSYYIPINPTGHTYYYDFDISVNTGNQFYIGFERFDADKTSRSNNATVYIYAKNSSVDINHQHIFGTVDLSTDGVNPCAFIALRILNGWGGTTSGVTGTATIHSMSLREISTMPNQQIQKNGTLTASEFKEYQKASFYKNGFIEASEFIEM